MLSALKTNSGLGALSLASTVNTGKGAIDHLVSWHVTSQLILSYDDIWHPVNILVRGCFNLRERDINTGSSLLSQASLKITKAGVSINRIELKLRMQMKLILRFPKIKPAGGGKSKNGIAITSSL